MDVSTAAVSIQQASLQQNVGLAIVKQAAQAQEQLVNVISAALENGRGQNLDISV
jgi:hypothetical protein